MASPQANIDIIATKILVDAQQALAAMKLLRTQATSTQQAVDMLALAMKQVAAQTGVGLKQSVSMIKELGSAAGFTSKELKEAGINAGHLRTATRQAGGSMTDAFKRTFTAVNAVRIALGALVSMLLFQVIQAFATVFTEASNQARQLEDTLYRLGNIEESLSKAGQDITLKGLEDGITRIQSKLPIFSREDVSQLVGTLAISTKQLGLTEQQILDLAQAVAVLNIRSEKQETLSETSQRILSSLITGNAKGIANLGIAFTENLMTAEAMRMEFIKAGESVSDLTENEKGIVKLNIVLASTGQELSNVNDYLETNTAKLQGNKAAWNDLLTTIGQGINNMLPNIAPALTKIQKTVELSGLNKLFKNASPDFGTGKANWMDVSIWAKIGTGIKLTAKEYERLKEVLKSIPQEEILKIFPDPAAIKDRFTRELVQSIVEIKDTATGAKPAIDELLGADGEEAAKAMADLLDAIEEVGIAAQDAREDLAVLLDQKKQDLEVKVVQKAADIDTEYLQKGEDAARDYGQKIEDINLDAQQAVEDAKRKAREDEFAAERDMLQKLKELRQDFLLDLEDALHERDARQVLRLIKEYKNDRQNIIDKKKLDDQTRKDSLAADLKNIEIERQRKLQDAAIDYQQKLAQLQVQKKRELEELAIWKQRELDDLALWNQREMEEIDRHSQQKIEKLIADYAKEYSIHAEMQGKINALLTTYFGNNMAMIGNLMAYMASLPAAMSAATAAVSPYSMGTGAGYITPKTSPYSGGKGSGYIPGMAEGGTIIAKKPTVAVFGERGAEAATFKPIGRSGTDVNKVFGGLSGAGGESGKILIEMLLSPDLEARVVDNALKQTAEVVTRISRSK